jgi:hypothetical protein
MQVHAYDADEARTAAMKIGDLVLYHGRDYYLRGFDPMSVLDRKVFLEDAETGEELSAPAAEVELSDDSEASGLSEV